MSQWKTIDTVPKDPEYGFFLVWDEGAMKTKVKVAYWYSSGSSSGVRDKSSGMLRSATHWMPLPKPPEGMKHGS